MTENLIGNILGATDNTPVRTTAPAQETEHATCGCGKHKINLDTVRDVTAVLVFIVAVYSAYHVIKKLIV
jgi:hypothetical protein